MDFVDLQEWCWKVSEEHGWHEDIGPHTMVEKLCLIHSEVSEALEEWRNGKGASEVYYADGKPEGIPVELADVVIRVMDLAEIFNIDLQEALIEKMAYNDTRPYKHGGKRV